MRQKNQLMRFNDSELNLMKALFADNEDLLFVIRKVLLQFELLETEKNVLNKVVNETVFALLKKVFLPSLEADAPLLQLTDMRIALNVDLKGKTPFEASLLIKSKALEIKYLEQQFAILKDLDKKPKIKLDDLADLDVEDEDTALINITAWNYLVAYIDGNLQQVKFLAGKTEETVEQTKERLAKNSAK